MFEDVVERSPGALLIRYFDGSLTVADVASQSDAAACGLIELGVIPGDRVALYLQNVPQFVLSLLAVWKVGAIAVPINPMWRADELERLVHDCEPRAVVCLESLFQSTLEPLRDRIPPIAVVTTSELDYQTRNDLRVLGAVSRTRGRDTTDFVEMVARHRGQRPPATHLTGDDVAVLSYTSGTTGDPKGAMNTHANLLVNGATTRDWMSLSPDDRILGLAPLFHITGLVCQVVTSLLTPSELLLSYRFEPTVMLDSIREHRPTFAIGAVTAFIGLMNAPGFGVEAMSSLRRVYSGGAPVAPATARSFLDACGHRLHNCYGLTETTAPTHFCPVGVDTPVDPTSGALSIGVPSPGTTARVVGDDGGELPSRSIGEIVIAGPQVVPGYWKRPDANASAFSNGYFKTGDVGFVDDAGWFYLVDRKKDMIIAGGYKVWPREVEDVLYEHPSVREAAVVGVPDAYRGETVKAYVSLKPEATATPEELIDFCRSRIAAYKYPRLVEIIDELPKTTTGKIMRRSLRTSLTTE